MDLLTKFNPENFDKSKLSIKENRLIDICNENLPLAYNSANAGQLDVAEKIVRNSLKQISININTLGIRTSIKYIFKLDKFREQHTSKIYLKNECLF